MMEADPPGNDTDRQNDTTDWAALLAGGNDDGRPPWITLTPERVSYLSLHDCLMQLELAVTEVDRLAFAAKSAHMALQAALTAALAGTANVGAHDPKLRRAYLEHFEGRGAGPPRPSSVRVMSFPDLLAAATTEPLPWVGKPLALTERQHELLARLTEVRHAVEHPKQQQHSIGPRYVVEALPVAAAMVRDLLATVFHHLEPGDMERVGRTTGRISELCRGAAAWCEG